MYTKINLETSFAKSLFIAKMINEKIVVPGV